MDSLRILQAHTTATNVSQAVEQLRAGIGQPNMKVVLLFCSSTYDLAKLGPALGSAFPCPVVACTSAGQIGKMGYIRGGITATSIAANDLSVTPFFISPLSECRSQAAALGRTIRSKLYGQGPERHAFGLLLVDGLSLAEDALTAALYQATGNLPIIGGSAGDDLVFKQTAVYWQGAFHSDAAVLALFETNLPVSTIKLHHFRPTEKQVVITSADPHRRTVFEFNGMPAVETYAKLLGMQASDLGDETFSMHPLMLRLGSDFYIRAIQKKNSDGSLSFFCAIDEGLVLSIGEEHEPLEALKNGLQSACRDARGLVIGCDCILRRLGFEHAGQTSQAGATMAQYNVVGFSTYGEQYNSVHVSQTFTGIVIGS